MGARLKAHPFADAQSPPKTEGPAPSSSTFGLHHGRPYFASWAADGAPLRKDLWSLARVTDSAMSPNYFAANPGKDPIPLKSVPKTAPPVWLGAYGRGKAIAVLTWIGPEGGTDPTVEVVSEYMPPTAKAAA